MPPSFALPWLQFCMDVAAAGGVEALVALLQHREPQITEAAAEALRLLVCMTSQLRGAVAEAGAIQLLAGILYSAAPGLLAAAAAANSEPCALQQQQEFAEDGCTAAASLVEIPEDGRSPRHLPVQPLTVASPLRMVPKLALDRLTLRRRVTVRRSPQHSARQQINNPGASEGGAELVAEGSGSPPDAPDTGRAASSSRARPIAGSASAPSTVRPLIVPDASLQVQAPAATTTPQTTGWDSPDTPLSPHILPFTPSQALQNASSRYGPAEAARPTDSARKPSAGKGWLGVAGIRGA